MFKRFGLTAPCLLVYPANHTESCRERIERELKKEPEAASRVASDRERIKPSPIRGASQKMCEDLDQRPDRQVVEGSSASSFGDGVR